jgi:hypothetical protein
VRRRVDVHQPIPVVRRTGGRRSPTQVGAAVLVDREEERPDLGRRVAADLVVDLLVDWALGEALAFGSLVLEGTPVRLSGQDSRRGTFSQRHSMLADYVTEDHWVPLANLAPDQAPLHAYDSRLVQEEHENMGADRFVHHRFHEDLPPRKTLSHAARVESGSPASGSITLHELAQRDLVRRPSPIDPAPRFDRTVPADVGSDQVISGPPFPRGWWWGSGDRNVLFRNQGDASCGALWVLCSWQSP